MTEAPAKPAAAKRPPWRRIALLLLALLVCVVAAVRYGPQTPLGRQWVETALDGKSVGRVGRLHVEGLAGDVWRDFTLRRLTISDGQGVWLDARDLRLRWSWPQLIRRRLTIDEADAGRLTIQRAPALSPPPAKPGGASPVSLFADKIVARVELMPALSVRYGLYDVNGAVQLRRLSGLAGHVNARSLTHAGDRLDAAFDFGRDNSLRLAIDAREAEGGALAGALGLAANQPFFLTASASGTTSQGRFQVASRSGALTPLTAEGAWSPQGGAANGRIALAASSHLSGYQRRLGPEVAWRIVGTRSRGPLSNLTVSATSENVDLTAVGEADVARRVAGPKGMAVTLVARDAQRVVGWPAMGPARFAGAFGGRLDHGLLAGALTIDGPELWGYKMARAAGPAKLTWGGAEIALQAGLDGQGGGGSSLLAALLGSRPHIAGELVWPNAGGFRVRSIGVNGPGLAVNGEGAPGLLGGFSFKGQAKFSNFAAAHAGAHGQMTLAWTAGHAGNAPWAFTFDAAAKDFGSGIADLDKLVGPAPALKGQMVWDGHAFQVRAADLTGQAGSASATGPIGGDGSLGLKLSWRIKGPVDIGPLEMSGAAQGTGDLAGTIGAPRADLSADFAALDLPQLALTDAHVKLSFLKGPEDTNGVFALVAASRYGPARIDTGFRFAGDGVDLTDLAFDAGGAHAAGRASLRRGAPSAADLSVSIGPGAFLSRGEASGHLLIAEASGVTHAELKLNAANAMTKAGGVLIDKASLTADGPLSDLPYRLQAEGYTSHGSWRADGGGVINGVSGRYGATFMGTGKVRNADFRTLTPAVLKLGDHEQTFTAEADVGGGHADVSVRQAGESLQAKAALTDVGLGLLDQDVAGRFDANLSLEGEGAHLGGQLEARLTGAMERGVASGQGVDGVVKAQLAGNEMTVDAQLSSGQGLTSHAHLVLPTEASAAPFRIALVRTAAMHGDFAADGEVRPLWTLLMGGERTLSGNVHAVANLSGTLADPQAKGEADISAGSFADAASGLKLTGVSLQAQLDQTTVNVSQLSGQDGAGGSVSGQGRVSLERAGASSFHLQLQRFRLIDNDLGTAAASGQALLSRDASGSVKLSGVLSIDHADVAANPPTPSGVTPMEVVEINRHPGTGGHLQAVNAHAPAVALDVTLKASRGVLLKGRGLNVELSLDAHVTGDTTSPQLSGAAHVVGGDYDFAGKRFLFDTSGLVTLASNVEDIRLDLSATREDPSLTAVIKIGGTAARPTITLTSTPVLPSDEVLSQVLFGTSTSQLSPLDAATLASAMSSLAGGAGFDVAANLRAFAHLDRLALGGDMAGSIISGGKYVTNNVYIEVAGGPTGPTGGVEWRVQKSLSVISRVAGQGGDSQVEVRWRKDF